MSMTCEVVDIGRVGQAGLRPETKEGVLEADCSGHLPAPLSGGPQFLEASAPFAHQHVTRLKVELELLVRIEVHGQYVIEGQRSVLDIGCPEIWRHVLSRGVGR